MQTRMVLILDLSINEKRKSRGGHLFGGRVTENGSGGRGLTIPYTNMTKNTKQKQRPNKLLVSYEKDTYIAPDSLKKI